MECPRCGVTLVVENPRGPAPVCEQCGWGKDRSRSGPVDLRPPATRGILLSLLWVATLALTVGPYYLLENYWEGPLPEDWRLWYIGIVLLYLGICISFSPRADMEDLGWFGGLVNNPFSFSDNYNRFLLTLAMLLAPGKLVAHTLYSSWRLFRP